MITAFKEVSPLLQNLHSTEGTTESGWLCTLATVAAGLEGFGSGLIRLAPLHELLTLDTLFRGKRLDAGVLDADCWPAGAPLGACATDLRNNDFLTFGCCIVENLNWLLSNNKMLLLL